MAGKLFKSTSQRSTSRRPGKRRREDDTVAEPSEDVLAGEDGEVVIQREVLREEGEIRAQKRVLPVQGDAQGVEDGYERHEAERDEEDIEDGQADALAQFSASHLSPSPPGCQRAEKASSSRNMIMDIAEL